MRVKTGGRGLPSNPALGLTLATRLGIAGSTLPPNGTRAIEGAMPRKTKLMKRDALRRLLSGIAKRFPPAREFVLEQKKYTRAELAAVFEAHLRALDAVDQAHAAHRAALRKEDEAGRAAHHLAQVLQRLVAGELGRRLGVLADFGWKVPKKPGPKTTKAKLAGTTKARATREARKMPRA
jgi:hypothetical protein